jgi:hypothetical protein
MLVPRVPGAANRSELRWQWKSYVVVDRIHGGSVTKAFVTPAHDTAGRWGGFWICGDGPSPVVYIIFRPSRIFPWLATSIQTYSQKTAVDNSPCHRDRDT